MKLIVLSDLHLPPPGHTHGAIDSYARFQAAIDRVNTAHGDADLVVIAGDLVDRGQSEGYEGLRATIAACLPPVALTLGNHDERADFAAAFGPAYLDENGFAQSAYEIGDMRVIVLDSCNRKPSSEDKYSGAEGYLCAKRLSWLKNTLDDRPTILVLHHPVMGVRISLDSFALSNPAPLLDLIDTHDVRAVVSGHIHMTTASNRKGVAFYTIAGGHSTSREDVPTGRNKMRFAGPAQMAVILADLESTIIHFDNYVDANPTFERRTS
ncbi:MAG: metallophosphoesterase [Pseudomonadota bacterium]